MLSRISDSIHLARTLSAAGVPAPTRPDRALRAMAGLHRWGPTRAAGYLGAAARYPDAAALIDELGRLGFAEVHRRTNALASAFSGHGIHQGDGVAIMCRNHRGFIEASVACSKLGAHAPYINTGFAGPQVTEVVTREDPVAIVDDQEFESAVEDCRGRRPGFTAWAQYSLTAGRPSLEELIATGGELTPAPPSAPGRTVILTSGTTGTPKGPTGPAPARSDPPRPCSRGSRCARGSRRGSAPLFHSWGFAHLFLSTALASTLVLRRRFEPLQALRAVQDIRATAPIVVPVMLQRMLELDPDTLAGVGTSSLRVIAASGSALPGPLAQRVMDAFGEKLYNFYGSTEVAWATIATPEDLRAAPGTAGRAPRGTVVKILGDDWRELAVGQSGRSSSATRCCSRVIRAAATRSASGL